MDGANFNSQIIAFIKANLNLIKLMEQGLMFGMMIGNIKELGNKIKCMEKD